MAASAAESARLMRTAVRVLACLTEVPPRKPSPVDLQRLRLAVPADKRDMDAETLASEVILREAALAAARSATTTAV